LGMRISMLVLFFDHFEYDGSVQQFPHAGGCFPAHNVRFDPPLWEA
jgi:hypothetical protein